MAVREPWENGPPDLLPGLSVAPFRAVRYATTDPDALARRTSPVYDLIDAAGRAALEHADPYNVVRLILPRADDASGDHDPHRCAARLLGRWRSEGVLVADAMPTVYRYTMSGPDGTARGVLGTVGLREPDERVVLPHEDTMPGPVADRAALTAATRANIEPILLAHEGGDPLADTADRPGTGDDRPPWVLEVTDGDGVHHRTWPLTDPAAVAAVTTALAARVAVIADGHHRYAGYLRHRADSRPTASASTSASSSASIAAPGQGGDRPQDRALALLIPVDGGGLTTRAIHRLLPGLDLDRALAAVPDPAGGAGAGIHVETVPAFATAADVAAAVDGLTPGRFLLTDGRRWVRLSTASTDLDVNVAHRDLIRGAWRLPDDDTGVFFGYGAEGTLARRRVLGGCALFLAPTPAGAVLEVARAGRRMPRKSTLFVPKPRTGMLLRCYSDED